MINRLLRIKMKYSWFYMLFTFNLFLLILNSSSFSQQQLPSIDLAKVKTRQLQYRLELVKVLSTLANETFIPVDLEDDGKDEIIMVSRSLNMPYFLSRKSIEDNRVAFQNNYYGQIVSDPTFFDIDGDGNKEIIFSEMKHDTTYIHVLNNEGDLVLSFVGAIKPKKNTEDWDCVIDGGTLMDVNDDGWLDLLLIVHTGYAYQPRGLFAYDVHDKQYIWKYKTGFHVLTPKLIDINNDGQSDILLGSSSPDNGEGRLVNGTDDRHTYLTVLDLSGNFLNDQIIGQEFGQSKVFIHDLNGDSKPELIVNFQSHRDPKEMSFVTLWNPMTGNLSPKIKMEKDLSEDIVFLDADRNGKDDFLIGWSDGMIEIRDYNFEIIISRKYPGFVPTTFGISDLNNDGEEEIVVSGSFKGYPKTIIINRKLKLLVYPEANLGISAQNCFFNAGFGMDKLLLTKIGSKTILMKMEKQVPILPLISWNWLSCGIILGMLVTGIGLSLFITKRYRRINRMTLNSLINTLQEGLIILNSQGCIVALNQMMEELFKMNREDIIGLPYKKVFSDSIFDELVRVIDNSYHHKYVHLEQEITIFQKDKTCNLLISIGAYPLGRRKEYGKLITMRNITEIVQSKRAVAWASLAQKLAHEIKTPLSTIMLTAQRLQMEYEGKPEEAQKTGRYLSNIVEQVHRLRKMTDALMKFAKIETPKFEPVNINAVISDCLDENRIKIGSGIHVEKSLTKDASIIKADRQQLHVAFQNIIDNGITAMQGKGIFTVKTTLVQSLQGDSSMVSQDAILIEIADTGKGILPIHLNQLFQPFFSKFPDGTGLGLVIVKKIIDDHQGNIQIESQEGIGTTVFITLPIK